MGRGRQGNVYIEIMVAVAVFMVMLLPLLSGFRSGARQTQLIRSHSSARYLAEWALAQTRALVAAGFYEDFTCADVAADNNAFPLTNEARSQFPGTAAQLQQLSLTRSISCLGLAGGDAATRVYEVEIKIRWTDPGQPTPKELVYRAVEGEEI